MGSTAQAAKRPIRIGGASRGFSDRVHTITQLAKNGECDVVVGDWLCEMTMTLHGAGKVASASQTLPKSTLLQQLQGAMFAENFIDCFNPAIPFLHKNSLPLAVNAGASDTKILAKYVKQMCEDAGCPMDVTWVEGDEVTEQVMRMKSQGEKFESLIDGRKIEELGLEPVCAQAYLGGLGIARAFEKGVQIVICGRVADAAPIMGLLRGGMAGIQSNTMSLLEHLSLDVRTLLPQSGAIFKSNRMCILCLRGYYSAFKDLLKKGKHLNVGFPIAEIDEKGECLLTNEKHTGGIIDVGSVTSQLLYGIQGPFYYNSDVVAQLEGIKMVQQGGDRVHISGVKGLPPPPTTKVGITAPAGWQAEYHIYLVGLDIEEKARWTEEQIRESLGPERISKFSMLKFHVNGSSPVDSRNQDVATVDFRIFAQSTDRDLLKMENPCGLFRLCMVTFLEGVPDASLGNDMRQAEGKPYYECWVALLPQSEVKHRVHCLFGNNETVDMGYPKKTQVFERQQPSYETSNPVSLDTFGETVRAPFGYIALGRGGDKASDCNNGFFVRNDDEWDWLRTFLTIEKIVELLGPEEYKGKKIDRFEMPHIRAVHFLLHDHLDRGYNACSTYDALGKNCMEYLRAKTVDLPKKFLDRGTV